MACRNNYMIAIIMLILLYFLICIPMNAQENFFIGKKGRKEPMNQEKKEYMTDYGEAELVLNEDRSDIRYYRINPRDNKLNVPDANAPPLPPLKYESDKMDLKSPAEVIEVTDLARQVGSTYCDELIKRQLMENTEHSVMRFRSNVDEYYDE